MADLHLIQTYLERVLLICFEQHLRRPNQIQVTAKKTNHSSI